jgi:aryl carrier-like protein
MEKSLRLLWSKVLNVEISAIRSRSAFLQLGGDSISAMQLMSSARGEGIRLTMLDITKSKNLRELAQLATPDISSIEKVNGFETETVDTLFELSPIQKHYFNISPRVNDAFEQSMLLKITQKVPILTLIDALEKIVKHHSALRARYKETAPGSWMYVASIVQYLKREHQTPDE